MLANSAMNSAKISPKLWLFIFVVAALHLWPFALYHVEGDARGHFFNLECFGRAMLEGVFYPRWCAYGNDSIGSPAMFFYFPFPYFISLPFYPLTLHLINTEQLLVLQLFIVNIVTILGCLAWFRQHISLRASVVLAIFYFWFPYRSEALFFRVALAELWVIALFPWLMWSLNNIKTQSHAWLVSALLLACCILSHIPCTLVVLTVIAVLYATKVLPTTSFKLCLKAGALAIALTTIYWIPLLIYHPLVMGNTEFDLMTIFPNRQPLLIDFERAARSRSLLNSGLTLLFISSLIIYLFTCREIIRVIEWKRSLIAASVLLLLGLMVVLPPISAPLWQWLNTQPGVIGTASQMIMPWRFQALLLYATMLIALVFIQAIERKVIHRRTLKMDVAALFVLILFQCLMMFTSFISTTPYKNYDEFLKRAILPLREYRTIWQHAGHRHEDLIAAINKPLESPHRIVSGEGRILRYTQTQQKIVIDLEANTPVTLQLRYLYFPTWHILSPDNATLTPAKDNGEMQITVPSNTPQIVLEHRAYDSPQHPWLKALPYSSFLLWFGVIGIAARRAFNDKERKNNSI